MFNLSTTLSVFALVSSSILAAPGYRSEVGYTPPAIHPELAFPAQTINNNNHNNMHLPTPLPVNSESQSYNDHPFISQPLRVAASTSETTTSCTSNPSPTPHSMNNNIKNGINKINQVNNGTPNGPQINNAVINNNSNNRFPQHGYLERNTMNGIVQVNNGHPKYPQVNNAVINSNIGYEPANVNIDSKPSTSYNYYKETRKFEYKDVVDGKKTHGRKSIAC
ncbi:hypothetical protein H4219_006032 [Mycoemilia scoparia]|uniref:Uncharacterized protein n=1 Tax=Mycoemilia scoparia TaxID=417184 RepID=A0A9W8DN57_9FUNG|nr:hypothetical protein H4219_006032 [Mycoemilia scoparia]